MKGIEHFTARMAIMVLSFIASAASIHAADKTVTMKVGETKRLSLPSYITSKTIKGSQWISTRPDEIEVVSQTAYSATVKAKKSVPSTTTCLVHCQYYYYESVGSFTYMRTGIYDFKVETEAVQPTHISLPPSLSLNVGERKYLTPTITPSDAETDLTWSSSRYSTINVFQNGSILAQREGSSVITVRTSNGLSASCTVTAVKPQVEVTSIQISTISCDIEVGATYTLTATVFPTNATDKTVTWSSNAPDIVSVDKDGTIRGISAGNAIITASSSNGKEAACSVTCKAAVQDLVISDGNGLTNIPSKANIRYERTFHEGWNSVCLPFAFDAEVLGLENAKIALPEDVEVIGSNRYVSYRIVEKVEAGVPCLVYVPDEQDCKVELNDVPLATRPIDGNPLSGVFTETTIGSGCYKLTSDGKSFALTKTNSAVCKPFRAYFRK